MYLLTREDVRHTPDAPARPVAEPAAGPTLQPVTGPEGLAAVEARLLRKPKRRQLAALALLYAADGREQDLLRMLDAAVAAGVDPDRALDAIRELPRDRQGVVLAALLERHPEVEFDGHRLARIFEDAGDRPRAVAALRAALPDARGFDADLTQFLLRLDPSGGARFLFELEDAKDWRGDDLQALLGFFVEAGQEDQALAFVERALEADPDDHDTLRVLARIDPAAAIDRPARPRRRRSQRPGVLVSPGPRAAPLGRPGRRLRSTHARGRVAADAFGLRGAASCRSTARLADGRGLDQGREG